MHKLSAKSRKRWPEFAVDAPRLLPTPASSYAGRPLPGQQHQGTADQQQPEPDHGRRHRSRRPHR